MQYSKKDILEAGAKFFDLEKVLERLPEQVRKDIKDGKKEFALAEYYFRKKFDNLAGIQSPIKATDAKAAGVTNLDKGKLPDGTFLAIMGVSFGYGYHAISVEPTAARYSNSEYLNTIPTRLQNSEFRLKNGDATILECRTRKFFSNAYAEYGSGANEENMVMLPAPKLAMDNKAFDLQIEFPVDAVAIPANNHFFELCVIGVKVQDRPAV